MITPRHTYIIIWNYDIDNYPFESYKEEIRRLNAASETTDFRQSFMEPKNGLMCASSLRCSINNWEEAKKGDRFFLYLISDKPGFKRRIVGSGFFYCEPYFNGIWTSAKNRQAYTVDADFDVMLNPDKVYDLLTEDVLEVQFPDYDWSGETTDLVLDYKTAYLLERKWWKYLVKLNPKCHDDEFWCRSKEGIESMYAWDYKKDSITYGRAFYYMMQLYGHLTYNRPI